MAVLVNDNVMPYSPAVYDTVMLNTYKALNFWQQGDYDNARIEWNRTDDRQRRASEHFESEIDKQRDEIKKEQNRSEEHTSELQSLMRISYAVFSLKKKKTTKNNQ